MKMAIGILLAAGIGAGCRIFELPAPAPPKLLGAALVVAMTAGYMAADHYMESRKKPDSGAVQQQVSDTTAKK